MVKFKAFISYKHISSTGCAENLEFAIKAYAKPIYRPPVAVFRDEKYLRPSPDLPAMIRKNLEQSEYLIYVASPDAAASEWVQSELERGCSDGRRCVRLIMVLTDGNIGVDMQGKRIDWEHTDALPAALADKIQSIPLYLDLSWAHKPEDQTLLNPDYEKVINRIVAELRDVDPIVLSGVEVIQHRRNNRIRNAFVSAIGGLAVLLAGTAWFALQQMLDADARAREATSRRLAAEADRIAEGRIDTALLLMAQAYRMGDNTALRGSWWRLLGSPMLPVTYFPVRASRVEFQPDRRLEVQGEDGLAVLTRTNDGWGSIGPAGGASDGGSKEGPDWAWDGGCETPDCPGQDERGVWSCAKFTAQAIGPHGDAESICIRSRISA